MLCAPASMLRMSDDTCKNYCLGIESVLASIIATMGKAQRHAMIESLERRLAQRKQTEEADEVISGLPHEAPIVRSMHTHCLTFEVTMMVNRLA